MWYLVEWARALFGRSGIDMNGAAALSYQTIGWWAALTGNRPTMLEIEGLMTLDAAMRYRPPVEKGE